MSVVISCTHCHVKMNVKREMVGKKIRCPKCQQVFASSQSAIQDPATINSLGSASPKTETAPSAQSPYESLAASLMSGGKSKPAAHSPSTGAPMDFGASSRHPPMPASLPATVPRMG